MSPHLAPLALPMTPARRRRTAAAAYAAATAWVIVSVLLEELGR